MAFARFAHFMFNDGRWNEVTTDSDSEQRKDFVEVEADVEPPFVEVAG